MKNIEKKEFAEFLENHLNWNMHDNRAFDLAQSAWMVQQEKNDHLKREMAALENQKKSIIPYGQGLTRL